LIHSPLTLLELAYQQHMKSNRDVLAQMCMEQELGMRPAECAHQVAFRRLLPIAFGTGEEWHKLPRDFHVDAFPNPSRSHHLRTALHATRRSVEEAIHSARLSDPVKGLLTEMKALSHRFIESMLSFMWRYHRGCVQSTAFSEED
jgi:hypothetical protein